MEAIREIFNIAFTDMKTMGFADLLDVVIVAYLIYRVIFFYVEAQNRRRHYGDFDFYGKLSISEEKRELFALMETGFQNYVQGGVKLLSDTFSESGKPILPMGQIERELARLEQSQILVRMRSGEQWHVIRKQGKPDADGILSFVLDFEPGSVDEILILPGFSKSLLRSCFLQEDEMGSGELAFVSNGVAINPILYLYDEPAVIAIRKLRGSTHRVYVSLEVVALPDTFVVESKRSLCDLKETLANRNKQLEDVYQSTSWKITRPLRKLRGND